MNDIYVAVALLGVSVAVIIWLAIRRPSLPDAEPAEPVVPATEQCAVQDCPREWQTDRSGWRLCHTHYRELVTDRNAS